MLRVVEVGKPSPRLELAFTPSHLILREALHLPFKVEDEGAEHAYDMIMVLRPCCHRRNSGGFRRVEVYDERFYLSVRRSTWLALFIEAWLLQDEPLEVFEAEDEELGLLVWRSYPMAPEAKALLEALSCVPLRNARLWRRVYEALTLHGREGVLDLLLPCVLEEALSR